MHAPDEDLPIANLFAATVVYAETAVALTG
jgi:acetylornithine deacetylase/succinyl-diaminopimelate desuccinylase-like protein